MNVHGFWSNSNARKHGGENDNREPVLVTEPSPPPGRHSPSEHPEGTWRSHIDQAAVARAKVALCQLPEVKQ